MPQRHVLQSASSLPASLHVNPANGTFVDVLLSRSQNQPDQIGYHFVAELSAEPAPLSYAMLFQLSTGLAALLQEHGLTGERVLLPLRSNNLFVIAFYACLLAGAIAVPTPVPHRELLSERLRLIAENSQAKAAIFDSDQVMQANLEMSLNNMHWLDIRQLMQSHGLQQHSPNWRPPSISPQHLAFIQYTSGSTGAPKGVMISHRNLMVNSESIRHAFGHDSTSRVLTALPLFHDMGLVGGILQPLYAGIPVHLMTPVQFLQKPARWLQLLSEHQITSSGGPNFMYEVAQTVSDEQLAGIDLSHWSVAFCGAEPIRTKTMAEFVKKFSRYGFKPEAFFPCYGMAESTLFVTGHLKGTQPQPDKIGTALHMTCGYPGLKTDVVIVDPESRQALPEGCEGEIWVRTASVADGYWNNPEATEQIFHAHLAETEQRPYQRSYLRTGDLGYLRRGELFVSGRLKELIILNGQNYVPHDLELTAQTSHEALNPAGSAAFTIPDGEHETLIMVCEIKRPYRHRKNEWAAIEESVRSAISRDHAIRVHDVVLLLPGSMPRTSSGKIRRQQCRIDYIHGRLARLSNKENTV